MFSSSIHCDKGLFDPRKNGQLDFFGEMSLAEARISRALHLLTQGQQKPGKKLYGHIGSPAWDV